MMAGSMMFGVHKSMMKKVINPIYGNYFFD